MSRWSFGMQWHQLDHMQTISISLQTDNDTNTSSLNFYRPDALPDAQPTVSKHWRHSKEGTCNERLHLLTWNVMNRDGDDEQNNSPPALVWRAAINWLVAICYVAIGNCRHGNVAVDGHEIGLACPCCRSQPRCFCWPWCHTIGQMCG